MTHKIFVRDSEQKVAFEPKTFSFFLFGKTLVTLRNPAMKNTFGVKTVKPSCYEIEWMSGKKEVVEAATVQGEAAYKVRRGEAARIIVELA